MTCLTKDKLVLPSWNLLDNLMDGVEDDIMKNAHKV